MKQVTLHGKPIKVGDKVWDSRVGWSGVKRICVNDKYPIETEYATYKENGFRFSKDTYPSLFWKEQNFDLSKPLPDLKVDDKVIVWENKGGELHRHFCKFDSNGDIVTFNYGQTSWTNFNKTSAWQNWRLPDNTKGK